MCSSYDNGSVGSPSNFSLLHKGLTSSMQEMNAAMHIEVIHPVLGGVPVNVTVTIANSWQTVMDFVFSQRAYNFNVTTWSRRGLSTFLSKFLEHYQAEPDRGTLSEDGTPIVSYEQKIAAVMQACRDIFTTIDMILTQHGRGMLDYAVWYRERHHERDTYADMITRVACNCIVHADMLAPQITWEVVRFH